MGSLDVAVVSRDDAVRLAAARAFDDAPPTWNIALHRSMPSEADVVLFGSDIRDEAPVGALVFDPHEASTVVERVRQSAASARTRTILVTGAGHGVGVTTVALHLSLLAARSHTACFVDLDLEWGAASRLGMTGDFRTWADIGEGVDDLRLSALPVSGGFRALLSPGSAAIDAPRLVTRAEAEFDRVIIDCNESRLLAELGGRCDLCVLVVAATLSSARRARSVLESVPCRRWALVMNRLGPGGEITRGRLQTILQRKVAVELPCTPALRDLEDEGRLLSSGWGRFIRRMGMLHEAIDRA